MSSKKISELPASTPLNVDAEVPAVHGGITHKATAQQINDLIDRSRGAMRTLAPGGAFVLSGTVAVPILGPFVLSGDGLNFDIPALGRLRYTGELIREFVYTAIVSLSGDKNNFTGSLFLAVNGSPIADSEQQQHFMINAIEQMVTSYTLTLNTNDTVSLWFAADSKDPTMTVAHAQLVVSRLG